jgi:hypothetical protein
MRKNDSFWLWGAGLGVLLIGAGAAVYHFQRQRTAEPTEETASRIPTPAGEQAPRPVPVAPPAAGRTIPLPALDDSDAEVAGGITEIFGRSATERFLVPQRIVRNVVVTVDNLTREKTAIQQRPIKPTGGAFVVSGSEDNLVLSPENYARYTPFVTVVQSMDAKTLVGFYRGLQPLFQQAFEELGHPNDIFNNRLLEVVDHLLQTPDVQGPVRLVQPTVYYRFADPKLESLSAGQKLLLRMGPDNARIIKAKLREIQAALI